MIYNKTLSYMHIMNRLRLVIDYIKRKPVCSGLPNEITIELTNNCNLRCIMCPRNKMTRPRGYMNFDLFKKIIDQSYEYTELIDLDLFGESLTHPDLIQMIEYCKSRNLNTMVSTNLTPINDKMSEEIIKSGLDAIIFSLDGATKETYEKIRIGADYDQAVHNIETFLEKKRRLGSETPYTIVQMVYMKDTTKEAEAFINKWEKTSVNVVRLKPFFTLDREKSYMSALSFDTTYAPCIMLWRKLTVFWNGTVGPCCNDYDMGYVLGNLNFQSVNEIWNGRPMQELRKIHAKGDLKKVPLCRDCKPFEPGWMTILGSIFVDDLTVKKLLPYFEKKIVKGSRLMKYS